MKHLAGTLVLCFGLAVVSARADHGPGGSGGGVNTSSAETLKRRTFSLTLGIDYAQFERVDDAEGLDRSAQSGDHVDAIDYGWLETIALSYGVTDKIEVGLSTGHYSAGNARIYDAGTEEPGAEPEVRTFDPEGFTDLWLNGKYRFARNAKRSTALFGAIKAPTGKNDVVDSGGLLIEPPSQPGTGAWDAALGIAHTERLSPLLRMDTSLRYTTHQRKDDFRIGDRLDAGVSFCYRISAKHLPNWHLLGEVNARLRQRNDQGLGKVPNSGGKSYFATVGIVTQLSERIALTLVGVTPFIEDLNGSQVATRFKYQAQISFEF